MEWGNQVKQEVGKVLLPKDQIKVEEKQSPFGCRAMPVSRMEH